ncbi:MAG: CAP domain-containing protein [Clostridiales bacterium]|nr:CAP domain-containing protein [Clostridiales bacterium]
MKLQYLAKVFSKNLTVLSIASAFALGAFGMSDIKDEFLDTSKWFRPQPSTDLTAFENVAEDADANPFEKNSSGLSPELDPENKGSSTESATELTTTTTTEATTSETSDPSEDSSVPSDSEDMSDPEATSSTTAEPDNSKPSDGTAETTKKKETKEQKETKETKETTSAPKETTTAAPTETTTAAPTETTAAPTETTPAATEQGPMGDTSGSYNDDMAAAVLTLVNNERAANGLAPLSWSNSLAKAAKTRATEIVVTWSHTRPDGSAWYTVSDVTCGENLGKGQTSSESVMAGWMNSDSHRYNILLADYKTIGVACYACNGKYYWVQEFGY